MTPNLLLAKRTTTDPTTTNFNYHKAIGMLLYLTRSSHPNILYTTTYLSHFINTFNDSHVMAIKRVLRYLIGTCNLPICYNKSLINQHNSATLIPIRYADADWGNTNADQCSISGVVFLLTSGPISWMSKMQWCITLSSTKAEINAISKGAHEALFLHHLMPAFVRNLDWPILLYNNNQSSLKGMYHCHMKHYRIKLRHLRKCLGHSNIHINYCPTNNMPADILTKALSQVKIIHLTHHLHMENPPSIK
jgi:hypothetical protein